MKARRRRPNGRFWTLLALVAIIIAAAGFLHRGPRSAAPSQARHAAQNSAPQSAASFALSHWSTVPLTLNQPMMGFAAVHTPGAIWILGGLINDQSITYIQKMGISANGRLHSVRNVPPGLPIANHDGAAVLLGRQVILLGGGSYLSSNAVFRLPLPRMNPATTWNALPLPLSDLQAVTDQNRILVVGGHDSGAPSSTIWVYNPGHPTKVWAHLPIGVRYAAVARDSHMLYSIGGLSAAGVTRQAVAYNLATGKMTKLPPYPMAVQYAEAAVIGGHLVVAGGKTASNWTNAVYWYNSLKHRWVSAPAMPAPAGYGALVAISPTQAVWLGGEGPSGTLDVVWRVSASTR